MAAVEEAGGTLTGSNARTLGRVLAARASQQLALVRLLLSSSTQAVTPAPGNVIDGATATPPPKATSPPKASKKSAKGGAEGKGTAMGAGANRTELEPLMEAAAALRAADGATQQACGVGRLRSMTVI